MRAKFVNEENFERGKDPVRSLDIGKDRKVKRGDRVQVIYKGEPMIVTALDDESIIKDRVMVRSPHQGMSAEYNTYEVREFDFKDDEGDICFAEMRDHLGKDYWEVPEYPKRNEWMDESVDFERGQDPKDAMKIGKSREIKIGDHIRVWVHDFGESIGATVVGKENNVGYVMAELSRGGHWVSASRNENGGWEASL